MPCHIGQRKQQIAELGSFVSFRRRAEFGNLLGNLGIDVVDAWPVETNPGGLGLQLQRTGQTGQGQRDRGQ